MRCAHASERREKSAAPPVRPVSLDGTPFTTVPVGTIDRLARVDPATGRATIIGSIGFRDVFGLALSPDGQLFGAANGASTVARLSLINTATGAGSSIADIRIARGMDGLTSRPAVGTQASPTDLQAQVTGLSVRLSWMEVGAFAGAANLLTVDVGPTTIQQFGIAAAPPGVYFVRVKAVNSCGVSGPSNEVVVDLWPGAR